MQIALLVGTSKYKGIQAECIGISSSQVKTLYVLVFFIFTLLDHVSYCEIKNSSHIEIDMI